MSVVHVNSSHPIHFPISDLISFQGCPNFPSLFHPREAFLMAPHFCSPDYHLFMFLLIVNLSIKCYCRNSHISVMKQENSFPVSFSLILRLLNLQNSSVPVWVQWGGFSHRSGAWLATPPPPFLCVLVWAWWGPFVLLWGLVSSAERFGEISNRSFSDIVIVI